MATKALEPKAPRSKTPFLEKNGDNSCTLGNPRWKVIPYFPVRSRVQEVVSDIERAKCKRIISEYRENSQIAEDNDIGAKTAKIQELESSRISQQAVEAQALRKELIALDHQLHLAATDKITMLIDEAFQLVKTILDRCIESYDAELNEVAISLEANAERLGFPLFSEQINSSSLVKDFYQVGRPYRTWDLWNNRECTFLHSCREVCRNLRQKFDREKGYTIQEVKQTRSIPTMLFLCTSEEVPSFQWL